MDIWRDLGIAVIGVRKILRENAKARLRADPDWRYRGSLIGSR